MHRSRLPSPSRLRLALAALLPCLMFVPVAAAAEAPAKLEVRRGDHIALIGNTLADRMQHDGWLEAHLYSRFPKHDLVVRDLGFSGDELTVRLRSANFGSPDDWLTRTRADVVLAFFGYNESFAGREGLGKFKKDLAEFIDHTLGQKYNGKGAPRLVLFSPIAHEDIKDPNLPDGTENNERLELYTGAMAEVAKAKGVPFVDLFHPTKNAYLGAPQHLTINGIHLTEAGNYTLAHLIDKALFPEHVNRSIAGMDKIRQAVLDKNFIWFNRYRTVDGFSIYGGRADLRFVDGQTNRVVMDREMEVLDVMTANRDKRVWAVAQGGELKVDDSNTPPFIPVKTNKPGNGPNGEHIFLSGEEAITKMTVAKGMKVSLFASEKEFPDLAKPVQMTFDPQGRLWVAVWPSYPHWKPKEELNDKLLIFEDTDGDGKADKETVFADRLHCPTGFEFANGGVLLAQAPDLMFLQDTDGDGKADVRSRVLHGLDSADTHHTANSFATDPGGAVYFQEGTFHHTQVETPYGPPVRNANAAVYRYEPKTRKFEVYVPYGFANPHGHAFDKWGQDIVTDGTGANPYHAALFSGHLDFPQKHPHPPQVYQQRTRPCPGIEFLYSRHFPEEDQGNLLVANVIGFQGILQYKVTDKGASLAGTEVEPIVSSTDPNFRPSDLKIGPDGAIWFIDWQNPIIGHMQHNLRDPSRDRTHGRIYRVTYEGRPLLTSPKIAGQPIPKLLDLLKAPESRVRTRARTELGARKSDEVLAALKTWVNGLDKNDPDFEHHRTEALWLYQYHNMANVGLLKRVLASPDFHARAAATRVLCYWRDRVPDALGMLKTLAADPYPRVRLEAVRAASFFTAPEAVEVALISAEHPTDEYIDFVRNETMKALEPYWKKAVAEGQPIPVTSVAGARFFLKNLSTDELLKLKRSQAVDIELLFRRGVPDETRRGALADLSRREGKNESHVLVNAIRSRDDQAGAQDESVVFDLARLLNGRSAEELSGVRDELVLIATNAHLPVTRQLGFVALIAADGGAEKAWALGTRSTTALRDLLLAVPLIRDPGVRASLYPRIEPLLDGLPRELASSEKAGGHKGRYIRIELPGRRKTLTLAEVEVYSDGRNIAPKGKASQSSTANGGEARRAVDGNTSGRYNDRGQTHTAENQNSPWWELDLGGEFPIDSIAVSNRTEGDLGKRLNGFTLKVLDGRRRVVFEKAKLPAPKAKAAYEVGGEDAEGSVRRAAMVALTSVRGKEADTFKHLARFVKNGVDRPAAVQALQRIPTRDWPADEARPLLDSLLASIRTLPANARTTPEALDALQLGETLATLLPRDQARAVRKELGELGVRVIRLGTVLEQMLFDKERFAVRAGKPVQVVFENTDMMPHNFVVTAPGSLEEIGQASEAAATDQSALERGYIPRSPKVLAHSRLLQPRESEKVVFTAPTQPGVYPYVCTYPGHWRRMFGAMYVVEDLDEYLSDPESYLASHPLPVKDELLKFNRPRKEWKLDDLASFVSAIGRGGESRSHANGKQMFQVANCIACHKLGGVGTEIGPDLTQLAPQDATPIEVLKNVLEPSAKINEKYQTYVFETETGRVISGLVVAETPDEVKVLENPLAKAEPVVLKKSEIADRVKSPNSVMPKGLLDKLTREEILDLIGYVTAKGDPKNPLYQGGDHAHHHGTSH